MRAAEVSRLTSSVCAWEVLGEYRRTLDAAGYSEHADIVREARLSLKRGQSPR
jgi:hypothetical protein